MKPKHLCLLFLLAAIWGGSFVFMRVLSPQIGALHTAFLRLFLGGIFLFVTFNLFRSFKKSKQNVVNWQKNGKKLFLLGLINSALPFTCYAVAALYAPAAFSSLVNACSPLLGALLGVVFLKEKLTVRKFFGFLLGIMGVVFLVNANRSNTSGVGSLFSLSLFNQSDSLFTALLLCLSAALCYAVGGLIVKLKFGGMSGTEIATGSSLAASLILFVFIMTLNFFPVSNISPAPLFQLFRAFHDISVASSALALGIVCSGAAYLIYFKLMQTYGPAKTLSVTYLMPLFSIFWGWLFLSEHPTWKLWLGGGCVLCSIWLTIVS
jgi:drug/metabolite transporter (DMT)-like permease